VDLSSVKTLLKHALHILSEFGPGSVAGSFAESAVMPSSADVPAPAPSSTSGQITSRDEVLRCLERVLTYYARHEPSSPLPVLLIRAKSLIHADFAAIVRNLIPDGISQFENLRGPNDH
jgi:type VI secretion system protein ImpA